MWSDEALLAFPERFTIEELQQVWSHWFSMQEKGEPFCFIPVGTLQKSKSKSGKDSNTRSHANPPASQGFSPNNGIPVPCECSAAERTDCLLRMATKNHTGKFFTNLIRIVDVLEVLSISILQHS